MVWPELALECTGTRVALPEGMAILWDTPRVNESGPTPTERAWQLFVMQVLVSGSAEGTSRKQPGVRDAASRNDSVPAAPRATEAR